MRRLLPALLAGMLLLAGCSSSEADAASVTSAETSYAGASEAEQETQDVTLAETVLFDQDGIRITATGPFHRQPLWPGAEPAGGK